jgi:hypothetical protein
MPLAVPRVSGNGRRGAKGMIGKSLAAALRTALEALGSGEDGGGGRPWRNGQQRDEGVQPPSLHCLTPV